MSFSPSKQVSPNMILAENHEKIIIEVVDIKGTFVEKITRVVMSDEGKRYITYRMKRYQVKKLKFKHGIYRLKLS